MDNFTRILHILGLISRKMIPCRSDNTNTLVEIDHFKIYSMLSVFAFSNRCKLQRRTESKHGLKV